MNYHCRLPYLYNCSLIWFLTDRHFSLYCELYLWAGTFTCLWLSFQTLKGFAIKFDCPISSKLWPQNWYDNQYGLPLFVIMWCILSPGYSNGRTKDFPRLCFSIFSVFKVHQFLVVLTLSVCHNLCACISFHLSLCEHVCHCICLSVSLHLHLSARLFATLSLC